MSIFNNDFTEDTLLSAMQGVANGVYFYLDVFDSKRPIDPEIDALDDAHDAVEFESTATSFRVELLKAAGQVAENTSYVVLVSDIENGERKALGYYTTDDEKRARSFFEWSFAQFE